MVKQTSESFPFLILKKQDGKHILYYITLLLLFSVT